jgi:hypothetical protein
MTAYGLAGRGIGVRFLVGAESFAYSAVSRPALGSTQPLVRLALGPGLVNVSHKSSVVVIKRTDIFYKP